MMAFFLISYSATSSVCVSAYSYAKYKEGNNKQSNSTAQDMSRKLAICDSRVHVRSYGRKAEPPLAANE